MTLRSFPNNYGTVITPYPFLPVGDSGQASPTIDAAGESYFAVGHILLSTGVGTSATLDNTGKIHVCAGTITFVNAGTNVRVGVQDVTAGGVNDDSWASEPQVDLTGGTSTFTANVLNSFSIASNSRSITHGDLISVGVEMTTRGGVDSVQVQRGNPSAGMGHGATDSGAGPGLSAAVPAYTIEFGDGTIGWFEPSSFAYDLGTSATFSSVSTPDEYALVFQIPFKARASGLFTHLGSVAAGDVFEMILYSDPLGTPVAERTLSTTSSASGQINSRTLSSGYILQPNTNYAIALRPTTGSLTFGFLDFNTGNGNLRKATMLGTSWSQYQRSDQTGAFGSQDTTKLPLFGVWLDQFDDGVSTGSGTPFIIGG